MTVARADQARCLLGRRVLVTRVSEPLDEPDLKVGGVYLVEAVRRDRKGQLVLNLYGCEAALMVGRGDRFDLSTRDGTEWVRFHDDGPPERD